MLKSYYSFDGKILRLHQYQTLTISLTAKSYLTDAKYYFIDEKIFLLHWHQNFTIPLTKDAPFLTLSSIYKTH